jgi:hypothetical protein
MATPAEDYAIRAQNRTSCVTSRDGCPSAPESATLVAAMGHDAAPDSPGTAIDALFALPLAEFTPARNALAAALKKAGDKAGAESVKALVKPSATAWAVNQVWWRQREVLGRVIDAGAAQRAAHVAWSHGRKADLRETAQTRDAAVRAAIDAAAAALSPGKPAAADAQYRISGTVQALASSGWPSGQRPGCLTHDLQSSGLEALGALADSVGPGPTRVPRGKTTPAPSAPAETVSADAPVTAPESDARRSREAAAKARVAELEALHADTGEAARATRAAAEAARGEADAATAHRASLEAQLDEARQAESAARRQLAKATAAAGEAEMKHARTSRELTAAREALRKPGSL